MNQMQKRLCGARIAKNIAYFIVPIFVITLIASIVCSAVMDTDVRLKDAKNYYETELFSDQYLSNIYQYYNYIPHTVIEEDASYSISNANYSVIQENISDKSKNSISYYNNNNTNFYYLMIDKEENLIITNVEHTMKTDTIEGIKQELQQNRIYWNYENGKVDTNIQNLSLENIRYNYKFEEIINNEGISIYTVLLNDLPYSDNYAIAKLSSEFAIQINNMTPYLIPASMIVLLLCAIVIIRGIGRTAKQEEIYLNWFDKWKLEIVLWICFFIITTGMACGITIESGVRTVIITGLTIGTIIGYLGCILLLETLVKRAKTHTLWKSTILYAIFHSIKQLIDNRKISTKLFIYYWGFCILGLLFTIALIRNRCILPMGLAFTSTRNMLLLVLIPKTKTI